VSKPSAWGIAVALTVANPLLHKPVSDVADWASATWGFVLYNRVALIAIPLACAIAVWPVVFKARAAWLRSRVLPVAILLALVSLAAQWWLLVANIELIHIPQFALVATVLLAGGVGPLAAYLAATAAGFVDEAYQHLVVYAGRADTYFDINDIVLDAIGAAWAIVLFGNTTPWGDRAAARHGGSRAASLWLTWPTAIGALLIAMAVAWWLDPPAFVPLLRPTAGGHAYRVLSTAEGLAIGALLLGLVRFVPASALAVMMCVAAGALSSACASAARTTEPASPPTAVSDATPFITTFWCGPPLAEFDDARAAEIAKAGFTIVGPPCEGDPDAAGYRRALDVAARHGLKLWVADSRFNERARTLPNWETAVSDAAAAYKDHPAFGGYFVTDEPSAEQYDDLAAIVARLREVDPRGQIYLNLLADYLPGGFGTGTYREYVERFITTVRPSILSYDYYPFLVTGDRPSFFSNLAIVRELAQKHSLPFMLILLAMPHGDYRDPTEAELSWQALHALAFGASGISYFAYWTPVNVVHADVFKFRHGLIEEGRPTVHYFEATRLNATVRAMVGQLRSFRSVSVTDAHGEIASPPPIGPISTLDGGAVTAGLFADDAGQRAVLLVNRDYRRAATIRLQVSPGEGQPQRFVAASGRWVDGDTTFLLAPGGGQLIRWPNRR